MPSKVCTKCKIEKEYTEFYKGMAYVGGVQSICKKCYKVFHDRSNFKRCSKPCPCCKKIFVAHSRESGCSLICRIMIAVEKDEYTNCWNWKKSINKRGYGQMNIEGKPKEMHRISYKTFVGDIPTGLNVLHKCDNRKCINPEHLWIGTQKENIQDMISKGRRRKPKEWVESL